MTADARDELGVSGSIDTPRRENPKGGRGAGLQELSVSDDGVL